jgi:hypothetical protein
MYRRHDWPIAVWPALPNVRKARNRGKRLHMSLKIAPLTYFMDHRTSSR